MKNLRPETTWRHFPVDRIPSSLTANYGLIRSLYQDGRILDVGCGLGGTIAGISWAGSRAIGVDINERAIFKASQTFDEHNNCEKVFIVGDARKLPFVSNSFDLVILQALLTVVVDPLDQQSILSEAYRVLSPKGNLYVTDFAQTWELTQYRQRYLEGKVQLGYDATFYVQDSTNEFASYYAHHFSVSELRELIVNVGFRVVDFQHDVATFKTKSGAMVNGITIIAQRSPNLFAPLHLNPKEKNMSTHKTTRLILASSSPRRKELLAKLGLPFEVITSNVSEDVEENIGPEEMVLLLARRKADAVAATQNNGIVIGSDTTIAFEEKILGKPKDEESARAMLTSLRGKWHQVFSGIAVIDITNQRVESTAVVTNIKMREYSDEEINEYLKTGEPFDKAGSYAIQGEGRRLVEEIQGSFDNVVGLPVNELATLLQRIGLSLSSPQLS